MSIYKFIQDYDMAKILYPEYVYSEQFIINPLNGEVIDEILPVMLQIYGMTWDSFYKMFPEFPKMSLKTYICKQVNITCDRSTIQINMPINFE